MKRDARAALLIKNDPRAYKGTDESDYQRTDLEDVIEAQAAKAKSMARKYVLDPDLMRPRDRQAFGDAAQALELVFVVQAANPATQDG